MTPRTSHRSRRARRRSVATALVVLAVGIVPGGAGAQPTPAPSPSPTTAVTTPPTSAPAAPGTSAPTTERATTRAPQDGVTTTTAERTTTTEPVPTAPPTTAATSSPTTATATPTRTASTVARATLPEAAPEGIDQDRWDALRRREVQAQACGESPGWVCRHVLDLTGNRTVAEASQWLVEVPLQVLVVLAIALVLNRMVRRIIRRHLARLAVRSRDAVANDPGNVDRMALRMATASSILGSAATALIFSIATLISLSELGIDLAPMLAGAGIAGIAIGFGAQNLVRDVLAGLFVMIEDQYGVGDIIDVGKASGVVEEFSLRVTKIRDVEGTLWFVPNGVITEVGNKTQLWARAILDIEVAYEADHTKAGEIIKEVADRLWREELPGARIIEEPELWGVERLGESGVAIRLAVKSAPADQFRVARMLRSEIKRALDAAGISIPFPQRTVWIRSAPAAAGPGDAAAGLDP